MAQSPGTKSYLFYLRVDGAFANDVNSGLYDDQVEGGTDNGDTQVSPGGATNPQFSSNVGALAIDPHKQDYFFAYQTGLSTSGNVVNYPGIFVGSTSTGIPGTTAIYSALTGIPTGGPDAYNYAIDTILINDIAVDQAGSRLFFTRQYEQSVDGQTLGIDAPNMTYSGLYSVAETGGAVTTIATGFSNPDAIALDLPQGYAFITDSTGVGYSGDQANSHNTIDYVNLSTGAKGVLSGITETYHPDASLGTDNYGGNVLDGVAVDPATNTLYFTQSNEFNDLSTDSFSDTNYGIYKTTYTIGANGTVTIGGITTLYSGAGTHDPGRITIDTADGVFYVAGNTPSNAGPSGSGIWEGSLASVNGTTLTLVDAPADPDGGSGNRQETFGQTTNDVPGAANLAEDVVPTVAAGGNVTYNTSGGPARTDSGLTTASATSSFYISATVGITSGFLTGDTLAATTAGTGISASYSNGVLTLSGSDTTAHYQQVLDSVTFSSSNGNPTSSGTDTGRTVTYSVYDGIATGTGTSTVTLEAPPIVAPGSPSVTFTGGGSPVAADPALTVTATSQPTLVGATISIGSGFLTGDTLGFTAQNGISGSYNGTTGVLTLSGNSSARNYQAAIRSVTFGFSPANGNPTAGNDTSRTLSYTVTDGQLASSAVSSTVSVAHAPPVAAASGSVTFNRGGTPVVTDPGLTVTAPDSGGTIASATVTTSNPLVAGDTLGFTNQNGITGVYNPSTGTLSLTGTATAAQYQAALDSVTFSTGNSSVTGDRTITYVVNDGTSNSASQITGVTVMTPTPTIGGAVPGQAVSDEATVNPFSGVTIGDAAGEMDSATITLRASGTASDANGTLSGAGLTKTGTGTYTLAAADTGTLTSELRALTFTPTAHQVAPGSTVTTGFVLAVSDGGGGSVNNSTTTVVATAATDAPGISGAHGPTVTTDLVPVQPFGGVAISEPDNGAQPTVQIEVRNNGTDTDANGTLAGTGLTKTGAGTYTLAAASPDTLTNEIDALTFTPAQNQVPVGQTVTTTFEITAAYAGLNATDGVTSVQATDVPCFCAGTLIATPGGEVPVEALAAGDLVLTASGAARPVRWVGRRSYAGRFLRANRAVWPVRIRAGALAENVPVRDLWISPLHALFLDGVLVPAGELVDGAGITHERVEMVQYFHVELDSHDVLLADGAPAESFVDDESRGMFHNAAEWAQLYPGRERVPAVFCAPRVESGPELEAIRRKLGELTGELAIAA